MKLTDFRDIEKLPIDFEEIIDALVSRIKEKLPNKWTDFLSSNFGMEIIDAIAYEAMLMYFEVNASLNEVYLPTAKTKTAVYRLANTIGYYPAGPSQATVSVRFYIENAIDKNINIPMYTDVSSSSTHFYTVENAVITAGSIYVDVEAKSGSLQTETFISTGVSRYQYKLSIHPVNSVEAVVVNNGDNGTGIAYTYTDFIDIADSNGHYYTLKYDEDFNGYISFGDGTYGINPKKGVPFSIVYVTGAGPSDNVAAYSITKVNDTIYDSSNTVTTVYVTNYQSAVGGSSEESISEIKKNVPAIYRDQSRCVTLQDYADIVAMYPGVKKVSVIDHTILNEIGIFGVKIAIIPDGSYYLNSAFKNNLTTYLESKKIFATQFDIIDPTYVAFDVTVNVKANTYTKSSVISNNIRTIVNDYLYWENRDFGGSISKLDLYTKIKEIPGVLTISDISITENSKIVIAKDPIENTSVLTITDNTGSLNTGCSIVILSADGSTALTKATIIDYDKTTSVITLNKYNSDEEFVITSDLNISKGCIIYPILLVDGNFSYGDKLINIKAYNITTETDTNGNYVTSYKTYNLLNMSYLTIYFGDDDSNLYHIMYVSGDSIYLDRELEFDVANNTVITVMCKNFIPTLASVANANAVSLLFTTYPRFGVGSSLIRKNNTQYTTSVCTMTRGSLQVDYLSEVIDVNSLAKVQKIYTSESNVFIKGTDYMLQDNDRVIEWTSIGLTKISANTTYYVQYLKKHITDVETYVKSIKGKTVEINPPIDTEIPNGTVFDYVSDSYNLLPYEIATTGNITINII
jgi:hypothetical protein